MNAEPIKIDIVYDVPVERIWKSLTDANQMKQWYFDIPEFKAEPGFEFEFTGEGLKGEKYVHLCKITEVMPIEKLQYSWTYEGYEGYSLVTFLLSPEGDQTKLQLTHEGVESFPSDNPDFAKQNFVEGWTYITGTSLKNFLETADVTN